MRGKKKEQLAQVFEALVYFSLNAQKRHLRIIRESDMKQVLKITTLWKTELIEYEKISQNSNTRAPDEDVTAEV